MIMITKNSGISNILVDTCIWSSLLRRNASLESSEKQILLKLIQQTHVILLGIVRQEVLSGIRDMQQFERIRQKLRPFPDFPLTTEDYEKAAEITGVTGRTAKLEMGWIIEFNNRIARLTTIRVLKKEKRYV